VAGTCRSRVQRLNLGWSQPQPEGAGFKERASKARSSTFLLIFFNHSFSLPLSIDVARFKLLILMDQMNSQALKFMRASSEQDLDQKNSDRLAFPAVLTNAGIMPRNNWRGRGRRGDLFWPFPIQIEHSPIGSQWAALRSDRAGPFSDNHSLKTVSLSGSIGPGELGLITPRPFLAECHFAINHPTPSHIDQHLHKDTRSFPPAQPF